MKIENKKSDIGWGHQIRSYVLHPYRMVKDNRTNYENSNPDKVLDGNIDSFLKSSLIKSMRKYLLYSTLAIIGQSLLL